MRTPLLPRFRRGVARRAGGDIHLETAGGRQDGPKLAGGGLPVVIVDAVNYENGKLRLRERHRGQKKREENLAHVIGPPANRSRGPARAGRKRPAGSKPCSPLRSACSDRKPAGTTGGPALRPSSRDACSPR